MVFRNLKHNGCRNKEKKWLFSEKIGCGAMYQSERANLTAHPQTILNFKAFTLSEMSILHEIRYLKI